MTAAPIRALRGKLVVQREAAEETVGAIHIPTAARKKPLVGTILHVGPPLLTPQGVEIPPLLSPGERVVFHSFSGVEFLVNDTTYLLLSEDDILAVLPTAT